MLELFAGSCVMSNTFKDYGFDVESIDYNPDSNALTISDVLDIVDISGFDVVFSAPPCTYFSRYAYIHHHWKNGKPVTEVCKHDINVHLYALKLIRNSGCKLWFIENPLGILKHLNFMQNVGFMYQFEQCMYGGEYKKSTNIWSNCDNLDLKKCNHKVRHKSFERSYNYDGVNDRSVYPKSFCDYIAKFSLVYLENIK
jgi:hypothetical protein